MNNIDYKVGIYIRLSREDEEKEKYQESESIGNQRTLLMQYIRQNKLNFISEYVDDGVSGTSFDRPAFNRMIADIEAGKINISIPLKEITVCSQINGWFSILPWISNLSSILPPSKESIITFIKVPVGNAKGNLKKSPTLIPRPVSLNGIVQVK